MPQFVAILATAVAAYWTAPWWMVLFGALVLFRASCVQHSSVRAQLRGLSATALFGAGYVISAGHALAIASAAYILGMVTRLALG
jgi:hypothetical protein